MSAKEFIVGFDVREFWYIDDQLNKYLHDDIIKPLTVDSSIWGSVFNDGHYPDYTDQERISLGLGIIKLPEWIGPNKPLWESLEQLERYFDKYIDEVKKPCWIIAVTQLSDLPASGDVEPTNPSVCDESWHFVGFDIADESLESMLINMPTNEICDRSLQE